MKVGMIFECTRDGPDQQVCVHLARKIDPAITVESVTLSNKPRLIEECGKSAALLMAGGCDRIVIIWDLCPPWEKDKPSCIAEDCARIRQSLKDANVASPNVYLVCIVRELEAWLLADKRAVAAILGTRVSAITRPNRVETIDNPKRHLDNLFRTNRRGAYRDFMHAIRIVSEMQDLRDLNKCPTFVRFAKALTGKSSP